MEKKYRLLKDLPGAGKETIFCLVDSRDKPEHASGAETYAPEGCWLPQFQLSWIMANPEWFEKIDAEILFTRKDLQECVDYTLELVKKCNEGRPLNYMNHGGWVGTHRITTNWEPKEI